MKTTDLKNHCETKNTKLQPLGNPHYGPLELTGDADARVHIFVITVPIGRVVAPCSVVFTSGKP